MAKNTKTKKPVKTASKPTKASKSAKTTKTVAKVEVTSSNGAKPVTNTSIPKQISSSINKTLKGLDNEAASVRKAHDALNSRLDKITASVSDLTKLMVGLSNAQVQAIKPVKTVKPSPAEKASKTPVKVEPKPKETVHTESTESTVQVVKITSPLPTGDKPPLKNVIDLILADSNGPLSAASIYALATAKYGSWSRQSLYNALKDEKRFIKTGDGAEAVYSMVKSVAPASSVTDDEADELIKKMESNSAALANMI